MSPSLQSSLQSRWTGWQSLGLRVTVTLTAAVALLSVITGIANMGAQSVAGPLAAVILPAIQKTAGYDVKNVAKTR